jgi:hypothetical protein
VLQCSRVALCRISHPRVGDLNRRDLVFVSLHAKTKSHLSLGIAQPLAIREKLFKKGQKKNSGNLPSDCKSTKLLLLCGILAGLIGAALQFANGMGGMPHARYIYIYIYIYIYTLFRFQNSSLNFTM